MEVTTWTYCSLSRSYALTQKYFAMTVCLSVPQYPKVVVTENSLREWSSEWRFFGTMHLSQRERGAQHPDPSRESRSRKISSDWVSIQQIMMLKSGFNKIHYSLEFICHWKSMDRNNHSTSLNANVFKASKSQEVDAQLRFDLHGKIRWKSENLLSWYIALVLCSKSSLVYSASRPVIDVTDRQTFMYNCVSGLVTIPEDVLTTTSQLSCKRTISCPMRLSCVVSFFVKSWNLKMLNHPRRLSDAAKLI